MVTCLSCESGLCVSTFTCFRSHLLLEKTLVFDLTGSGLSRELLSTFMPPLSPSELPESDSVGLNGS